MKCNLCNSDAKEENFNLQSSIPYNKDKFSLYRCKNCEVVFIHPMPKMNNGSDNLGNYAANRNPLINFIRYYPVYYWLCSYIDKKEKVLDFGCGRGELVSYLRQKNWQAYGIDPMVKAAVWSSSYKNTFFSSLSHLKQNNKESFKAITLNFSLEHCRNPLLSLKELHPLLKPQGLIFIRVPNFGYILRNRIISSFQIKAPLHRYFFTTESLAKLLESAGFAILTINTPPCLTSVLTGPCSIFPELDPMNWLYEKRIAIRLGKGLTLGILSFGFLPYVLLKSQIGQGAIIHAVAKKILNENTSCTY